jgi:hypothetical protein
MLKLSENGYLKQSPPDEALAELAETPKGVADFRHEEAAQASLHIYVL